MPSTSFNRGSTPTHDLSSWFSVKPLSESQPEIERWFQSLQGERLLSMEKKLLNTAMPSIYGYHLMQLSVLKNVDFTDESPVSHRFALGINSESGAPAIANYEQLPIDAESLDAVLLHHVLDYSVNPHQLLREAARTVIPNGYLIIIGFNPFALFAIKKQFGRLLTKGTHWRYHHLRPSRVMDWLQVLEFEPVQVQYGYHGLPFKRGYRAGFDRFCAAMLPTTGAFYMIVARKTIMQPTLISKPWKRSPVFPAWAANGQVVPRKPVVHREPGENSQ